MHTMDAIERSYINGYEQGAKDYKEQRDLVLQENAELVEKIEQLQKELDAAVEQMRGNCKYCKNNFESAKYCISNCDESLSAWEWVGIDE